MSRTPPGDGRDTGERRAAGVDDVVPRPAEATPRDAEYRLTDGTRIAVDGAGSRAVAEYFAGLLRPSTGFDLPVVEDADTGGSVTFRRTDDVAVPGEEGYELIVTGERVTVRSRAAAGLFAGVQTLRQLLPAPIESDVVEPGPWPVPGGEIRDHPRFDYRGAHLDVARHFFDLPQVKRYVDHLAMYKLNHLHLHLTDDQGWRLEIEGWPRLTEVGASTDVGGGEGGYYTRAEYEELVAYAGDRFITVVPEVDVPGHTNAALASYGELNPDGEPADPYTGADVGFSALRLDVGPTETFLTDVFEQVAALTPGPYVHFGGDEAEALSDEEYAAVIDHVTRVIEEAGKRPVGWQEVLGVDPSPAPVVQYWFSHDDPAHGDAAAAAADREFVLSPARHAYLDMKYDPATELGLDWAGHVSVGDAYAWDPGDHLPGVDESAVRGVEAALWSETLETFAAVEFMLFPRLPAIAERGWTPADRTGCDGFRRRLAGQGPRWERLGIAFHRAPGIDWLEDG
jgi:hexosaminidase